MSDLSLASVLLSVAAGMASVLSPCVLPVVPVIVAGAEQKDRLRPLLIVIGLSLTFMIMGAVSSLFGAMLIGKTRYIEQAGGMIILIMGFMVLLDMNVFKRLYWLSNIQVNSGGRFGGLVLGMALGVVWVPCIGPMLSSILLMVSSTGEISKGLVLLGFYSLGLAAPMLAVAYASQIFQQWFRKISNGRVLRYVMGAILVVFGLYVTFVGNFAFLNITE
ncbi:MAG: cytochrome c biogenesis protein CcdA [Nitrospirae bacterium]|nr:cytochrome c biogenesis protein CcdA [Nitrospirota bacterium]